MFVYTKAIELEPDNPQNYLNRGLAYADQGDYEAAIADFDKAIELDPDNDSAYFSRGLAYLDQGSYEPALDDYTRVIELTPDDAAAYNNRGLAYDNLGEFEQALDDYTRAIELDPADPDFPTPYNNRGWVYYLLEAYEAALADFDRAIELSPSSYSYIRRAVVYDALGDPVQAARDFDQALKQYDGDVAEAYNYLAWSLAHDLDTHYEEALKYARRSVELGPQAYNHDTLALVYYKLELYDKALEHYDIALSLDPAQSESYKGRGDVYLALDDVEAARLNYEIFVALAPPGPERTEIEQKIKTLQP
jgi:Flp pilus assembly protein TadD